MTTIRAIMHAPSQAGAEEAPRVTFRGVNHLALVTNDMDATVRFYDGVLGCRLVARRSARPPSATTSSRSARARPSPSSSIEAPVQSFAKAAGDPRPEGGPVRSSLPRPRRRGAAARPRRTAEGLRLRGHRGRRPRLHPLDLLHRPERHRGRGLLLRDRGHRAGGRLRRRQPLRRIRTRSPLWRAAAGGQLHPTHHPQLSSTARGRRARTGSRLQRRPVEYHEEAAPLAAARPGSCASSRAAAGGRGENGHRGTPRAAAPSRRGRSRSGEDSPLRSPPRSARARAPCPTGIERSLDRPSPLRSTPASAVISLRSQLRSTRIAPSPDPPGSGAASR